MRRFWRITIRRVVTVDGHRLLIELGPRWEIAIAAELGEQLRGGGVPGWWRSKVGTGQLTQRLRAGAIIPRWYGFAYFDLERHAGVYLPVPLHWLVALGRWWLGGPWHWFRFGGPRSLDRPRG